MQLFLGAIVHYVLPDGETHRPAIVVHIWSENSVSLQVFNDEQGGVTWQSDVYHDEGKSAYTWHWIEQE